uniref:Uncharacterized protein n=1 Tax=Anopheles culicifacies TaxID=139723 RepID=A0A182LXY2_9DIPT
MVKEIPVPLPPAVGRSNEKFGFASDPNESPVDWLPLFPPAVPPNENTDFVEAPEVDGSIAADDINVPAAAADVPVAKLNGLGEGFVADAVEGARLMGMFSFPPAVLAGMFSFFSLSFSLPVVGAPKLNPVLILPPLGVGFIALSLASIGHIFQCAQLAPTRLGHAVCLLVLVHGRIVVDRTLAVRFGYHRECFVQPEPQRLHVRHKRLGAFVRLRYNVFQLAQIPYDLSRFFLVADLYVQRTVALLQIGQLAGKPVQLVDR